MNFMHTLKWIAYSLVLLGALNWGLVGAFHFDLVSYLFGNMTLLTRIVYMIVGLGAIASLIFSLRDNYECSNYGC